ncbi:MAG TPA: glycoside hydrolase family 3 N-terminal domain-containing protein [Rectinemataceae bacterium]
MDAARKALVGMNEERRLAQLLMVGYPGTKPPSSLLRWIEERGIGGLKIFGWNAQDTKILAEAVRTAQDKALASSSSIPLLVATDQEGGWIRHVKGSTSESPGAMAIGATRSARDAYLAGYHIGKELSLLGIRMNFAPVADLATEPDSSIIGPRAFSDDPELAARLASSFAKGSLAAGVIPTAKHFPGHGATRLDSHGALPKVDVDPATFRQRELRPFAVLAKAAIPAMMTGHLAFPLLTGKPEPASLSRALIQGELRGRLRYRGLVITDDLYMAGASAGSSMLDTCLSAIKAGNDMILLSSLPDFDGNLWAGLSKAYGSDAEFRMRVDESAVRILATKLLHLGPAGAAGLLPDPGTVEAVLPDPEAQAFFADLAWRSVTLVKGSAHAFAPEGPVLIAAPFGEFLDLGASRYSDARLFRFSGGLASAADPDELRAFSGALEEAEAAIICVGSGSGLQFAEAARRSGKEFAVISVLSPAIIRHIQGARTILAVYHYAPACLEAGFLALSGRIPARGRLPLSARTMR